MVLHMVRSEAQIDHAMARREPGVVWGGPRNEVFPKLPCTENREFVRESFERPAWHEAS